MDYESDLFPCLFSRSSQVQTFAGYPPFPQSQEEVGYQGSDAVYQVGYPQVEFAIPEYQQVMYQPLEYTFQQVDPYHTHFIQYQAQNPQSTEQCFGYMDPMDNSHSNLMINYFPPSLTEEELKALFEPYGDIEQSKIVKDKVTGVSLCYGFVKYTTNEGAYKAFTALNGLPMENKKMKVTIARPMGQHKQDAVSRQVVSKSLSI